MTFFQQNMRFGQPQFSQLCKYVVQRFPCIFFFFLMVVLIIDNILGHFFYQPNVGGI